jgi:hypothetical protein
MSRPEPRAVDVDDLLPDLGLSDALLQRPAGIGSWKHAVRIALAVTVSWLIAEAVSQSTFSLFAPITTLLVVQTSPWTTLGVSVQRILGTGLGVLLASVYVNLVGLTWWSFLMGVLVALLIARLLPWSLGGQLQIPVAVVFVLALGPGTIEQDLWRVLDVVIGGVVGLLAVFVFPPRPRPDRFEAALRTYRDAVIATLRSVGAESGSRPDALAFDERHDYVAPSRRLRSLADTSRSELVRLAEGSQMNLRAGRMPSALQDAAVRLRRLSGIGVQVRGIVGAANRIYDRPGFTPGLSGELLGQLVDETATLLECVLGVGTAEVGAGDAAAVADLDARLSTRLRETADDIAARHGQVGDVLASVSILGRLDHIRAQVVDFHGPEETPEAPDGSASSWQS